MLAFEKIDTRLFKAFVSAAEASSFTLGARRAGITQSGMSQQIAKLEEQIGIPLFERINRSVLLTPAGRELRSFIQSYSDTLDRFVEKVAQSQAAPRGLVRYAMPASCLKTPHFPILLKRRRGFPQIDLEVQLLANQEIVEALMKDRIDFGFVTARCANGGVRHEVFAEEQYSLVSRDRKMIEELGPLSLAQLPMVSYPGMGVLFEIWRKHYFPKRGGINEQTWSLAGSINDLDGAITMVLHGVGCSTFPRHCVEEFIRKGQLFEYSETSKEGPIGQIYIVTRKQAFLPKRVERIIEEFRRMKSASD